MAEDIIGNKVRKSLILGIGSIAVAVAGIVLLIVGIIADILGCIIGGGVLLFLCFYLIPITWIHYSEQKSRLRIVRFIMERDRTPINMIASSLAISTEEATSRVVNCLSAGLLPGYALVGDSVISDRYIDPGKIEKTMKCAYCNATFTYIGDVPECPYCGTVFHGN